MSGVPQVVSDGAGSRRAHEVPLRGQTTNHGEERGGDAVVLVDGVLYFEGTGNRPQPAGDIGSGLEQGRGGGALPATGRRPSAAFWFRLRT